VVRQAVEGETDLLAKPVDFVKTWVRVLNHSRLPLQRAWLTHSCHTGQPQDRGSVRRCVVLAARPSCRLRCAG
jgi:hypothetical protein